MAVTEAVLQVAMAVAVLQVTMAVVVLQVAVAVLQVAVPKLLAEDVELKYPLGLGFALLVGCSSVDLLLLDQSLLHEIVLCPFGRLPRCNKS